MDTVNERVLGHISVVGTALQPLLAESTALFKAVVEDDLAQVAALATETDLTRPHNVLHWTSGEDQQHSKEKPAAKVTVKARTLCMLAAYESARSGKMAVLKFLLGKGVNPKLTSPDGVTAVMMAQIAGGTHADEVVALLQSACDNSNGHSASASQQGVPSLAGSASGVFPITSEGLGAFSEPRARAGSSSSEHGSAGFPVSVDLQHHLSLTQQEVEGDPYSSEGLPYSTSELTQPEYSTDDFRMFAFKVLRCSKRFAHDWRACPFAHPTENARRRDPRDFRYCAIACPDYKQGFCVRGDLCPYAHGVFEAWLHPSRYRTQLCKDGANCHRPICFFAHSLPELRTPTHTWTPGAEDNVASLTADTAPTAQPRQTPTAGGKQSVRTSNSSSRGSGGRTDGLPLTSPPKMGSVAAAMFGFTAPRMSNAFARRHGLNPKDNAMLNLQKIALQAQASTAANDHVGRLFHTPAPALTSGTMHHGMPGLPGAAPADFMSHQPATPLYGSRGMAMPPHVMTQPGSVRGKPGYGSQQPIVPPPVGSPVLMQQGYGFHPSPGAIMGMPTMSPTASHDPAGLAALNHHLAALNLHPTAAAAAAAYAASQGMGLGFGGMPGPNPYIDGTMAASR